MAKKKYTLYLPVPLARRLDQVARERHGAKSALVEEALRASFEPQQHAGIEDGLTRRLNEIGRQLAAMARDLSVTTETLGLFVRYFLTATPPVTDDDQESARLTGRKRYEVLLAEVGRRVAEGRGLAAEVLQTVPIDQPDLFAGMPGRQGLAARSGGRRPGEANGHG
ncbi:MAG TPA: CopG family transcriptional regulator [Hyphomicrobiaceae bacterium]|jgi:predicted transcriptional regulator